LNRIWTGVYRTRTPPLQHGAKCRIR
jgi:hypothetical protein